MEGSSNCILLQLGHFPSKLFTTSGVQEKSSMEAKTDGKMFNNKQTDSVPGKRSDSEVRHMRLQVASSERTVSGR